MTTLRPPSRATPATTRPERRGFAAIVPIARIFSPEHRDALLLVGTTVFLVGFGLVMVLSASSVEEAAAGDPFNRVTRQAIFAGIAIPLMLIAGRMPIFFWKKWAPRVLVVGAVLQLLVFVPGLSYETGGNRNWLIIGDFTMQPSEFVKLALVLWIGLVLGRRQDELGDWRRILLPVGPIAGGAIVLVLLGRDLGTAAVMLLIVFGCAYVAGARLAHLAVAFVVVAIGAVVVAFTSESRVGRITAWMNGCGPEDYASYCWQPMHGLWALASGGVLGVGLGNSKAKWSWLPEADSDYIFAIIGEELGLVGAIVVLALFTILAIALVRILRRAEDPFARIVTGGVLVWIIGQAFVNIAVVLGLLPVLGVPLPLISSGGSSLIAVLVAIGVVLSFTRAQSGQGAR